jgi:hypothetical protein
MDEKQRIPIPQELWEKLVVATESGRYMATVHYIDSSGTIQHFWLTDNFPTAEVVPSIDVVRADAKGKCKVAEVTGHGKSEGVVKINSEPEVKKPELGVEGWK